MVQVQRIPEGECPSSCALPGRPIVDSLVATLSRTSADFGVLLQRYGQPSPALRHYGLILWEKGEQEVAAQMFRAALTLESGNADLWRDLAGISDLLCDPAASEYCLQRSLDLQPDDARSWLMLAHHRNRSGRIAEAETAFERATLADPHNGAAYFGLGLLNFDRMQLDAAVLNFRRATETGYANSLSHSALGHALYLTGDFAACAMAFENAAALGPLDQNSLKKQARAKAFVTMIDGDIESALQDYQVMAGDLAEPAADIMRDAFAQFSAYGYRQTAIAVGSLRLERNPEDTIQRYLLDAVSGKTLLRAPNDYLEHYFDGFAQTFDHKLVEILHYEAPARMAQLIHKRRMAFDTMLDLGCGTGLAAPQLVAFGGTLTGVDISGRMLEKAQDRNLYTTLVKADALDFLNDSGESFDLVFAADMLVYLGDLDPLFKALTKVLRPGGFFAASIETAAKGDFDVLPSGRFAHAPAYLKRLAASSFICIEEEAAMIRLEAGRPADGMFLLFERAVDCDTKRPAV